MQRTPVTSLPGPILALGITFAVFPLWSLTFVSPLDTWIRTGNVSAAAITLATYWIIPICIVVAALRRSLVLLPLFLLECGALFAHSSVGSWGISPAMQTIRHGLLALMAGAGFVLMSREVIIPLLKKGGRKWRTYPRIYGHQRIHVASFAGNPLDLRALVENWSLGGVMITVPLDALAPFMSQALPGAKIQFDAPVGRERVVLSGELMWIESVGPMVRIGVRVADAGKMGQLITSWSEGAGLKQRVDGLWAKSSVRTLTIMLWTSAVGGTLWIPSCGMEDTADLAAVTDAPEDETVETFMTWSRGEDAQNFSLAGTGDMFRMRSVVEGCISGYRAVIDWREDQKSVVRIPVADRNCKVAIEEITVGLKVFVPAFGMFNSAEGASNFFESTDGERLTVVNLSVLPSPVTIDSVVAFAVAAVTKGTPQTVRVALPSSACEIVVQGDPMASNVEFEVRVHPVYLKYVRNLRFFPCGKSQQWNNCKSTSRSRSAIKYKNNFSKKLSSPAPYSVAAVVTLNNTSIRNQVSREGKSLECTQTYYLPR
jgi:hypothetical protein